ncbi:MAG: hypothetical protein NT085_04045 [candidate division SR1 bacterium]|nr:hypothetical protein [candidate division SR1 bacterium]
MKHVKNENPNWVKERLWFADLNNFKLGENFYKKILEAEPKCRKNKSKFRLLLQQAEIAMEKEAICTKTECGFHIEENITDPKEQQEHESVLGYIWWYYIYKNAADARAIGSHQSMELGEKQKLFLKQLRQIESLSLATIVQ